MPVVFHRNAQCTFYTCFTSLSDQPTNILTDTVCAHVQCYVFKSNHWKIQITSVCYMEKHNGLHAKTFLSLKVLLLFGVSLVCTSQILLTAQMCLKSIVFSATCSLGAACP